MYEIQAGTYRPDELHVLSFDGREEMNCLYSFDILVWGTDLDDDTFGSSVLGSPATLSMQLSEHSARHVRGIVVGVIFEGRREAGRCTFRLTLVPRLWLLQKRVNSRIFQDLTVQQIAEAILEEHGVARTWSLLSSYPSRQYCVHYQESDYRFLTRILAEEGIFFSFEQPPGDATGKATERIIFAVEAGDLIVKYTENKKTSILTPQHFMFYLGIGQAGQFLGKPIFACHTRCRIDTWPIFPDDHYKFIHIKV